MNGASRGHRRSGRRQRPALRRRAVAGRRRRCLRAALGPGARLIVRDGPRRRHHPAHQHASCMPAGSTWWPTWCISPCSDRPSSDGLARPAFVALYLVCGLVGSLTYVVVQPLSIQPAIGSSGAIAGVIAANLVLFPGATLGSLAPVLFLHVVESTPTLLLLLLWLATQVFSSVASLTTTTGIAWWAHLGGFASGLVLAPVLRPRRS